MNQEQHLSDTLESLKNYSTPSVSARELDRVLREADAITVGKIKALIANVAVGVLQKADASDRSLKSDIATIESVAKNLAGDTNLLRKELESLKETMPTESYNKLSSLVAKSEESDRERTRFSMEIIDSQLSQMLTGKSYVSVGVGGRTVLESVVEG
ncbi:hypothetical protein [Polynucleobacter sp. es-MAR-4]|uniref:hypothetical protein n=1 Tax=Polynucleobacter sp. es-MAR-4 TaxID=1855655 RepID=UPI001C0CCBCF|nr:hypothetical protein [Polynucleobacter sp. es-MAR-4]MBU3637362.1 hypothetical protein [Polynucleobacter sp. es-MAR-4]